MQLNADFFAAVGALAAVPVSIFAVHLARKADSRSKVVTRTKIYLTLRSRFIELHQQLPPAYPDPEWRPESDADRAAVARYWHHAFDEWYVTKHLDRELLDSLWNEFFLGAALSGLRHNGLRFHFATLGGSRGEHDTMWQKFSAVLEHEWMATHTDKTVRCDGFYCQHSHDVFRLAAPDEETCKNRGQSGLS